MTHTVLSGIRATGRLHFGNLMGAVRHFVDFQRSNNRLLYFVADLHTLTTLDDPEKLRGNVPEIIKDYLAAGLDPERSIIYAQSSVPEVSELSLLLSMIQPLGHLQRVPTYKDMVRKNPDNVNLGTITYPVLMAADILGPQADIVPVGEDQVPNVELTQALALRFNERFGPTFTIPRAYHDRVKVPGLDGAKMGKSDGNAIDINSPMDEIRIAYRKGVTDPARVRATDPGTPENCPSIYPVHLLATSGESRTQEIAGHCRAGTITCSACKDRLVDSLALILEPFQERRREFAHKDAYVREVLHEGGKKARAIFSETLEKVRDKMGVVVY